ncbi:MAG: hypothetical protein PHQ23_14990, partial [Candidatus Wallbacteria bacterium]|nr:hypothetical protein [Candidatus Wallbacteria bacterium]
LESRTLDLTKEKTDSLPDDFLLNEDLRFSLDASFDQNRKKWLEAFYDQLKVLDFLSKDHEFSHKKRKSYVLQLLSEQLELSGPAIEEILSLLASFGLVSCRNDNGTLHIGLACAMPHAIKFWLSQKEISSTILEQMLALSQKGIHNLNLFSLLKKLHSKHNLTALQLEEIVLDLQATGMITVSMEHPFVAAGYRFRVSGTELPQTALDACLLKRTRLYKLFKKKLKENRLIVTK